MGAPCSALAQEDQTEAFLEVGTSQTLLWEVEEHADFEEVAAVLERFLGEVVVVTWRPAALLDMVIPGLA
jgi:hypothetical protein